MTQSSEKMSFEPLSPLSFLDRSAASFGARIAVVDGKRRWTYTELHNRCRRLAGALAPLAEGRPVAVLLPNNHVMIEVHFGVPWAGVPLVTINTRLSVGEVAYILSHCEAAVLIYDQSFDELISRLGQEMPRLPRLVRASEDKCQYEAMLDAAVPSAVYPSDERTIISINYTSGTTGRPKGVMYHHRGAYLQALAMVTHAGLTLRSAYLWTLPMFHCNGWTFPWACVAAATSQICLSKFDAAQAWSLIEDESVTALCGAPAVLSMLVHSPSIERRKASSQPLTFITGGAPPSPTILAAAESQNISIIHAYGLTETYGPALLCDWHPEWDNLPTEHRARLRARQGVSNVVGLTARVVGTDQQSVPADGESIGEIVLRGNNVMLGYFKDEGTTFEAASGGWFHTGDLGVIHPDGYIELRDRSKDVIISGGENITSIEVEVAIASHPAVRAVAVVGSPDDRWGEVPVAFVALHESHCVTEEEIIRHVKDRLARFKAPKRVIFGELPVTSTGKIQKFILRERELKSHPQGN